MDIFSEPAIGNGPALLNYVLNGHAGGERSTYWFVKVPMLNRRMSRAELDRLRQDHRTKWTWDGKEVDFGGDGL